MKQAFLFLFTTIFLQAFGQDVRDIVRFSESQIFGSARFEAMGGSFGALGADLSCSSINPAGFGRYSSSTFGLSFQNTNILNKAMFSGTETQSKFNILKMNNLGFVFTNDISERNKGFIFQQLGFTFNKIQNFNNTYSYEGRQFPSLLDAFCSQAEGLSVDEMYASLPFSTALAWDTYAIDPNSDGTGYVPLLGNTDMYHKRTIKNTGGTNEYNFNISGNYMNKLYLGGNLGFRSTKFSEDTYHYETAIFNPDEPIDSFNYEFHLKTKGTGVNIKFGAIYLPTERLRLGLSLQSSCIYKFEDEFSANMTTFRKDSTYKIDDSFIPTGKYNYRLKTAGKVTGSLAYVFGTRGCINIDLEYVNHDRSKLKPIISVDQTAYDFSYENAEAQQQLRSVLNLRIGGEIVFNSQYFFRGGFALYPSAYDQNVNPSKGTQIISGGMGIKWKKSSFDIALKVEHRNFNYYAFNESLTEVNSFKNGLVFNYSVNF